MTQFQLGLTKNENELLLFIVTSDCKLNATKPGPINP